MMPSWLMASASPAAAAEAKSASAFLSAASFASPHRGRLRVSQRGDAQRALR
jgi:hypothetical protein